MTIQKWFLFLCLSLSEISYSECDGNQGDGGSEKTNMKDSSKIKMSKRKYFGQFWKKKKRMFKKTKIVFDFVKKRQTGKIKTILII